MTMSNRRDTRTGRGVVAVGTRRTNFTAISPEARHQQVLEELRREREEREAKHQAWLLTPEGIFATRMAAERAGIAKALAKRADRYEAYLTKWRQDADSKYLADGQKIGIVLNGSCQVESLFDPVKNEKRYFVLREWVQVEPERAGFVLASARRHQRALKCFLNFRSVDVLIKKYGEMYWKAAVTKAKVLSYSKSGKSAIVDILAIADPK